MATEDDAIARAIRACANSPANERQGLAERMAKPGYASALGMILMEADRQIAEKKKRSGVG